MTKQELCSKIEAYCAADPMNTVGGDIALSEHVNGLRMYDLPIIRVADAADPLFGELQKPGAVGPHFMLPGAWLPLARSVVSVFFPKAQAVKADSVRDMTWPGEAWLHARWEGQAMINAFSAWLQGMLTAEGIGAVAPSVDGRFKSYGTGGDQGGQPVFSSNWSERHVAFVCGMGTFGLSRGLITHAGIAGRLTSVITDLPLEADGRGYTDLYGYCSMCGLCAVNCPAGAITVEAGKDHVKCSRFLDRTRERHSPRYGCGKCQVGVPCMDGPAARQKG